MLRLSLHQSRPMKVTLFTVVETLIRKITIDIPATHYKLKVCVTELELQLGICQQLFKFHKCPLQHSLRQK